MEKDFAEQNFLFPFQEKILTNLRRLCRLLMRLRMIKRSSGSVIQKKDHPRKDGLVRFGGAGGN